MKIKSARFLSSASQPQNCPDHDFPEFALIGRSNVGKSSLVNLLTERKEIARVSDMPGKTQLLNFFLLNESVCLVDLPGYGYAKVAKEARIDFNRSVAAYIEEREQLACLFVLVDSRHEPQRIDLEFLQWLSQRPVPFALIFTKADKLKPAQLEANLGLYQRTLGALLAQEPRIFTTSATTRAGKTELLRFMEETVNSRQEE